MGKIKRKAKPVLQQNPQKRKKWPPLYPDKTRWSPPSIRVKESEGLRDLEERFQEVAIAIGGVDTVDSWPISQSQRLRLRLSILCCQSLLFVAKRRISARVAFHCSSQSGNSVSAHTVLGRPRRRCVPLGSRGCRSVPGSKQARRSGWSSDFRRSLPRRMNWRWRMREVIVGAAASRLMSA